MPAGASQTSTDAPRSLLRLARPTALVMACAMPATSARVVVWMLATSTSVRLETRTQFASPQTSSCRKSELLVHSIQISKTRAFMFNKTRLASERARQRAAGKIRRELSIKRQEAYFDLLVSGYSVEQIAIAMKKSPATVRRVVGLSLAKRRLDPPEDYARIQVARLTKALRCVDLSLEEGDLKAIAPFVKVVRELNLYHGLNVGVAAPYGRCSPGDRLNIASARAHSFLRLGRGNVGRRRKSCTKMHLSR